jgi:hypothetical protein
LVTKGFLIAVRVEHDLSQRMKSLRVEHDLREWSVTFRAASLFELDFQCDIADDVDENLIR